MAQSIFEDLCSGWDDVCGGGIWWNKSRQYKNAIANELFLKLSARLYGVTEDARYRDWAVTAWRWFSTTGLINAQHLVNDGLTTDCRNNGKPAWSYNQGVILGALVALRETEALVDQTVLDEAEAIADAALSNLTDAQGILREPVEGDLGDDGPQFKGIFVRNLAELAATVPAPHYRAFLIRNAEAIWERNRDPGNCFGAFWAGPFDRADAARQSAAIDCFNAASSLESTSV
jgi:predicted alpha-1,6-mannanase (GH76 family)